MDLINNLTAEVVNNYTSKKVAAALTMAQGWNLTHAEKMEFIDMCRDFTSNMCSLYFIYEKAEEGTEKKARLLKCLLKLLKPKEPRKFMDEVEYMNKVIQKISEKGWHIWTI